MSRLNQIQQHLANAKPVSGLSKTMAAITINSKRRMNSGFDIPTLGYGVYKVQVKTLASASSVY